MTEEISEYITKNINVCEICGKANNKSQCEDCLELEKNLQKLKNTSIEKYKKYLQNKLKEIKNA